MSLKIEDRSQKPYILLRIFLLSLISLPLQVSADTYNFELTPAISVGEMYDDNIDLDSTDKKSDYITTISPSISLNTLFEKRHLELVYAPTIVRYAEEEENNTVRHSVILTFSQELSQSLKIDLTDTYFKTEDPIEEDEEVETVRHARKTYQRNNGQASLSYLFGAENALMLGYSLSLLKNEDIDIDGGRTNKPFVTLSYWFNKKKGVELSYGFTKAVFWREDVSEGEDDHTGHDAGISYIYRFTLHTTGSVGYDFTNRNFAGNTEDYHVHEGTIGFNHAFSPDLSLAIECGYFTQNNKRSDNEKGINYDALFAKQFEHGRFTLGGNGGWNEAYLDVERRGFSRYWSAYSMFEYLVTERLSCYAGGSYRWDKDEDSKEWEVMRGSCGLKWAFLERFFLSMDYSYAERDDDDDESDYKSNRVMLTLSTDRLFRW